MDAETFVARDTKSALEKVKAKLGADAFILSTNRNDSGIEIAAISGKAAVAGAIQPLSSSPVDAINEITLGYLDRELKALREILYNALGQRTWQEACGKAPVLSALEQRLHTLGLSKLAVEEITPNIDSSAGLNKAWSSVLANIVSAIDLAGDDARSLNTVPKLVTGGSSGCRALICQQLITQSLQEGTKPSQILAVSFTKDSSVGLIDFCKREKVKRIQVASTSELRRYLNRLGRRKKVVIETEELAPSKGSNDPIFDLFTDRSLDIELMLVMPATSQSEFLRSISRHIQGLPIIGAIISHTSEAVSLGAVLDALILSELPLIGITRQADKVVQPINASGLINIAKRLARERVGERKFASDLPLTSRTA